MGKRFLKDVVKERKSSLKLSQVNDNGQFPVYGASGIVGYRDDFQIDCPSVAIIKDGAGIGRVSLLPEKSSVLGTMEAFVPNADISNEYLYFYLTHLKLGRSFTGSTIPHIYFKNYKNSVFPDESFENQGKIAGDLSSILNEIVKKKNQIDYFVSLVKSLFVEMFPEDGDFEHDTLSSITTKITDGSHNPPKGVTFSEYIMASSQNVNDVLNLNDVRYLSKEDFDRENKRTDIQKGDVLFTIVGTIGRTYVIKSEKMVFQRSVAVIKPKKNIINPIYLKYFLSSDFATKQIDIAAHGVAQKGIYLSNLKELDIVVPKIEVQDKFASFVEQIDKSRFIILFSQLIRNRIINIDNSSQLQFINPFIFIFI